MTTMDFGIPDLSTGRDPASDPTRRRDKAAGADFAAMLDQSLEAPDETPREREPVRTNEPVPGEKVREKPRHAESPRNEGADAENDPADAEAAATAAQDVREPSPTEQTQAAAENAQAATEPADASNAQAATEDQPATSPAPHAAAALPAPAAEPKAQKTAPVDPLAALNATPQPTPAAGPAPTDAQPDMAAKAPDATTQPAFAEQLANATGKPAEVASAKSKAKSDAVPSSDATPTPVVAEPASAAAIVAASGTASDNRPQHDASNGKPAPQPAPTIATSTQAMQNSAASVPAPAADPAAAPAPADDAQIVALVRGAAQQTATPQPAAPETRPAVGDSLPKDFAADAKATAPAKPDTPRPFGALAPGLGLAAQITAQQTPEQANAAERVAQLAAAAAEKVVPVAKGEAGLAPADTSDAPALRTEQPAPVDTPAARQASTDVNAVAATARSARPTYHPVVTQVAAQVAQSAADGTDRINIRLSPAELGRIDVKLDFGPDGRVQAVFAAERPQTMELLQRDARDLERALQDAGLRADSGSLSFNLRGNGRDNRDDQAPGGHKDGAPAEVPAAQLQAYSAGSGGSGRLDIRI
jgi:flagellar hook-length control protein FliK